jgi:hypothetical protein
MTTPKTHAIFLVILFVIIPGWLVSQESDYGLIPGKTYLWFGKQHHVTLKEKAKPLVQFPPVCGEKRRKEGMDIALPFGTGANFFYYNQYYTANDLQLVNDTIGIKAVGVANVQNSTSSEIRVTFRPDIWVLPFLNVYGIIGYTRSQTSPDFEVPQVTIKDIPNLGDLVIDSVVRINDDLIYYGPTYGGGVTISSGYKSFFFVLDYHYVFTKPKDLQDKLESHNISGKVGVLLGNNKKKIKGSIWAGTMFIEDNHSFTGEVDVKDILPALETLFGKKATYSGTVRAKQPWNFIIGGSVMINKHHILAVEAGYFLRTQVSVTYGFRF